MLNTYNIVKTEYQNIIFENRSCIDDSDKEVEGLFNSWILLNNPKQYNSYTSLQLDSIESSCNEYTEQDYKMLGGEKEIK